MDPYISTHSNLLPCLYRTRLRLESLEDAVIVENDDDKLTDRRGCPAYVAPEVLRSGRAYSGKAADIWSLGVLLYTMLVGRYPFNDAEHASLFAKISRGQFAVPEGLSPRAKCLIRSLLRKEPSERPYAEDVPLHPWLSKPLRLYSSTASGSRSSCQDQLVPELPTNPQQDWLSFGGRIINLRATASLSHPSASLAPIAGSNYQAGREELAQSKEEGK